MEQNGSADSPTPPKLDWTTSDFSQSNNRFPPENDAATVEAEDHNSTSKSNSYVTAQLLGRMHLESSKNGKSFAPEHTLDSVQRHNPPHRVEQGDAAVFAQSNNDVIPKNMTSSPPEIDAAELDRLSEVSGATGQQLGPTESKFSQINMRGTAEQKAAEVASEGDLAVGRARDPNNAVPQQEEEEEEEDEADWEGPDIPESIKIFIADRQGKEDGAEKDVLPVSRDDDEDRVKGSGFPRIDERSVSQHKKTTHWDTAEDRVTRHRLEWRSSALSQSTTYFSSADEIAAEVKVEDTPVGQSSGEAGTDIPSSFHSNDNTATQQNATQATSKQQQATQPQAVVSSTQRQKATQPKTVVSSTQLPSQVTTERAPVSAVPPPSAEWYSTRPPSRPRRPVMTLGPTAAGKSRSNPVARPLPRKGVLDKKIVKFALGLVAWAFSTGTALDDRWLKSYSVKAGQQDVGECDDRDRLRNVPGGFCTHFMMFSVVQMIATVVCSMGMLQLLLSCWRGVAPGDKWARRSLLLLSGMMFSFSAVLQGVALSLAATMISDGGADRGETFWIGGCGAIFAVLAGFLLVWRPPTRRFPAVSEQPMRGDEIMQESRHQV